MDGMLSSKGLQWLDYVPRMSDSRINKASWPVEGFHTRQLQLRTEFVNCRYTQSSWRANNMLIVDGQQLVRNVWFLEATESITQWRHNDGRLFQVTGRTSKTEAMQAELCSDTRSNSGSNTASCTGLWRCSDAVGQVVVWRFVDVC